MAFLATSSDKGPRDSPVWFLYEENLLWIFGTQGDSFIKRLQTDPKRTISIVDFQIEKIILRHVGVSAPQTLGLFAGQVLPFLDECLSTSKLLDFDLVELAPCYDQQDITAKFAAEVIRKVIIAQCLKREF